MSVRYIRNPAFVFAFAAVLSLTSASGADAAGAHGGGHGHGHGPSIGNPGDATNAVRTIHVVMTDNAFDPESIAVAKGETVRFVIVNAGEAVHEFNIGTAAMHVEHQQEMWEMVERGVLEFDRINHDPMQMIKGGGAMGHDDPNSVLLEPGGSADIVWTFETTASLQFACNVPGHYKAGMVGEIAIEGGIKTTIAPAGGRHDG
ncbi:MAG: cupredoxin domain-containing protein [Alphaproteobacteria bacterium]